MLRIVMVALTGLAQIGLAHSAGECNRPLSGTFNFLGEVLQRTSASKGRTINFSEALSIMMVRGRVEGIQVIHEGARVEVRMLGTGLEPRQATHYEFQVGCQNGRWISRMQGSGSPDGTRVSYQRERQFFLHADGSLMIEYFYVERASYWPFSSQEARGQALYQFRAKEN